MKKYRKIAYSVSISSILTVAAFFIILVLTSSRPYIPNQILIRDGMTKQEVYELLGAPPGRYGHPDVAKEVMETDNTRLEIWITDEAVLRVLFDENERVISKYWCNSRSDRKSWLTRVRHYFKL